MDLRAVTSSCGEARTALAELRNAIEQEIRSYPTPIPRCDAQFNHLDELRSRMARLQPLLAAAASGDVEVGRLEEALRDLLSAAPYRESADEQLLRNRLGLLLEELGGAGSRHRAPGAGGSSPGKD